jgi:hypothetical protein
MYFSSKSSALRVIGAELGLGTKVFSIIQLFNDSINTEVIQRWIV